MVSFEQAKAAVQDDPATPGVDETQAAENAAFTVGNVPGVELPSCGGPGTHLFAILGSILILGAGGFLLIRRRIA